MNAVKSIYLVIIMSFVAVFGVLSPCDAQEDGTVFLKKASASITKSEGAVNAGTITPDLFTGTMGYSLPITVPVGRNGLQPELVLQYRSSNGNGWTGMGWQLELNAIERNLKNGVNYTGNDFVFRMNGGAIDLIYDSVSDTYKAKIENMFYRFKKIGDVWEVTDKKGTKYFFGRDNLSRQKNPSNSSEIFKWCLDRIEDTFGNFVTIKYTPEDQGQIYLDEIKYNEGGEQSQPHSVKFYNENRNDACDMYTTKFNIRTAKRLKTIVIKANGALERAYTFEYNYSSNTGRSMLASVKQYGNDAQIDTNSGAVLAGSLLPATLFTYSTANNSFSTPELKIDWIIDGVRTYNGGYQFVADFDGDGKSDYMYYQTGGWHVALSTGTGFTTPAIWLPTVVDGCYTYHAGYQYVADFNGDGKSDYMYLTTYGWYVALSNGNGFETPTIWLSKVVNGKNTYNGSYQLIGDFNGDGKSDYMYYQTGGWHVALSTGTGFTTPAIWLPNIVDGTYTYNAGYQYLGDFNGDGKSDYMYYQTGGWHVALSTGTGFTTPTIWLPNIVDGTYTYNAGFQYIGDFNGDGKSDYMYLQTGGWRVVLSTGLSFTNPIMWLDGFVNGIRTYYNSSYQFVADFNNDGKTDYMYYASGGWYVVMSTGSGFTSPAIWLSAIVNGEYTYNAGYQYIGDFNGDGKNDYFYLQTDGWHVAFNDKYADLISTINNGLGGRTVIVFDPSTKYNNPGLPFPVNTLRTISTCDNFDGTSCAGVNASTTYEFTGGYFYIPEDDFRGFNYAKVIDPTGAKTQTWFHQGNDIAVDANNPNVPTGYMKGKPYRVRVAVGLDGADTEYSNKEIVYLADSTPDTAPYFNPPGQISTTVETKTSRVEYNYDSYGNVTLEKQYGDIAISDDDRTIERTFANNESAWIIGLPLNEIIYQGIGTTVKKAETTYYYDGVTDCNTGSTNQNPTKGRVTRIVRWNSTGASPEVKMAYDIYGNMTCSSDPNGNITNITYDTTNMFPVVVTNPLGHQMTTVYYDGIISGGLYGQAKSVTDPNGAVVTTEYDALGRKKKVTAPDNSQTTWEYSYGTIGSTQYVKTTKTISPSLTLSSWTYFDGLGRTILEKKTGPDSKYIVQKTIYDVRGNVYQRSLPYFEGEAQKYTTFTYDSVGRNIQQDRPDGTSLLACYTDWVSVSIDANKHKKRQTRDAYGRLITVEEYDGTFTSCDTSVGTPYATTDYTYDTMGNLTTVVDENGNTTTMIYDSLGRKTSMTDPDMGSITYAYDNAGNLVSQLDAMPQRISFQYDQLNRVSRKIFNNFSSLPDVIYEYDGATANGIGRLTKMSDNTGIKSFYYDSLGRVTQTIKQMDAAQYVTATSYDSLGRVTGITYPNSSGSVTYTYNGPVLHTVTEGAITYATYAGYNALGQPGAVSYANGVTTDYTYSNSGNSTCNKDNYLLCSITTTMGTNVYQDVVYGYDNAGNIATITDPINGNQTFGYDALDRLTSANGISYNYDEIGNMIFNSRLGSYVYDAHKVTTIGRTGEPNLTYIYDANGNMISGPDTDRTIIYYPENIPATITANGTTTDFYYDGSGERVKKVVGTVTTVYIDKIYECEDGVCSRYIFAGDKRIAKISPSATLYYHGDHLGSSSVVTNGAGLLAENITYYPYGETRTNDGLVNVSYKFTGKELDDSTGLYFYGARYYDPVLGRFITADTIVPNPSNPQTLNRYAYALNNPLIYTDPSGHWSLKRTIKHYKEEISHLSKNPYIALAMQLYGGGISPLLSAYGTYSLTKSEEGRNILAAEIIIGTTVAVCVVPGGPFTTNVLQGALIGELQGAYAAQQSGGDILTGTVKGGAQGALRAAASYGIESYISNPVGQLFTKAAVDGLINAASNKNNFASNFALGFGSSVVTQGAEWTFTATFGQTPGDFVKSKGQTAWSNTISSGQAAGAYTANMAIGLTTTMTNSASSFTAGVVDWWKNRPLVQESIDIATQPGAMVYMSGTSSAD